MQLTSTIRPRRFVAASVLALLAACSGGSGTKPAATRPPPRAATVIPTIGAIHLEIGGLPGKFADPDRDAVLAAIGRYVDAATLKPLAGKPANALADQFTVGAAAALTGPEHDALLDTSIPRATGAVTARLAPVALTALGDQAGAIDLIGSTFDLTVSTTAQAGALSIHRTGELMFTRDSGAWKILGFTLAVTRDGAGLGTVPTTVTGSKAP